MKSGKRLSLLWFVMGLGSQLQVFFSLSITECIVIALFPFCFMQTYARMRRNFLSVLMWLAFLQVIGCGVACLANSCNFQQTSRGFMVVGLILMTIPVAFWMLSNDFEGIKWWVVGGAISVILSTFVFQTAVEQVMYGGTAEIMKGPLFWISRLSVTLTIPCRGWYLQTPHIYSWGISLFLACFAMLTSTSGRSSSIAALGVAAICFFGGKTRRSIKKFMKKFALYGFIGFIGLFALNKTYRYLALNGHLAEGAKEKYEKQTHGSSSIVRLIVGGRGDSIAGLWACVDKPIVGWGPWALDEGGYYRRFLEKYGNPDDYEEYAKWEIAASMKGTPYRLMPAHSHITYFWLSFGIFGLVFMLYAGFVAVRFIIQDCHVAPRWFFLLACGIVGFLWGLLFSPFIGRVGFPIYLVQLLMIRAIRKGRTDLSPRIIDQICSEGKPNLQRRFV